MIDEPEIVQTEVELAAIIRFTIPQDEIENVMEPGMQELLQVLEEQGVEMAGPFFAHHLRMRPETFEFELGVPVTGPIEPLGRVRPGQLPAVRAARTVYHGPYSGLGQAWQEFNEWILAEGYTPYHHLWECYVVGPDSTPNAEEWETELFRPLRDEDLVEIKVVG